MYIEGVKNCYGYEFDARKTVARRDTDGISNEIVPVRDSETTRCSDARSSSLRDPKLHLETKRFNERNETKAQNTFVNRRNDRLLNGKRAPVCGASAIGDNAVRSYKRTKRSSRPPEDGTDQFAKATDRAQSDSRLSRQTPANEYSGSSCTGRRRKSEERIETALMGGVCLRSLENSKMI